MAELPGWDRDRLAFAPSADVEAARWEIYARVLRPMVTFDYPAAIHSREVAEMTGKAREREERAQLKRDKETLLAGQRQQVELRRGLLLDEPDDPDEDDES